MSLPMLHRLSILLVFCSLIAQMAGGVIPSGRLCACTPVVEEETCGCCAEKQRAVMKEEGACPCPSTCVRCETVRLSDARLTPVEGPRTVEHEASADLPPHTGPAPPLAFECAAGAPRAVGVNESPPPHLAALRTTVLLL